MVQEFFTWTKKTFDQLVNNRTETQHKVMKNTAWLFVAEIGSRVLRGVLGIIAARMLGATGLGEFAYAMALGGFITFFEEAGINMYVTREFSKDADHKETIFSTALVLKLTLLAIAIILFLTIGPAVSSLPGARVLIPVMSLVLIFDSVRGFFFSVSRSQQRMHIESYNQIITNILMVGISLILISLSRTPLALTWGYAIGDGIGLILIFMSIRKYIPSFTKYFSKDLFVTIFKAAWPFTIIAFSSVIIFNTDTLFLGYFASAREVGWYSAASRLIQVLYILPSLFATATFPVLVKKIPVLRDFTSAIKKSLVAVTGIMIPLILIIIFGSHIIIEILFGKAYLPSAIILSILSLSYVPVFISTILNNAVFAIDKQRYFIIANITGMITNVALDFILIPRFHAVGAAIAIVLSLCVMTLITTIRLIKFTKKTSPHSLNA